MQNSSFFLRSNFLRIFFIFSTLFFIPNNSFSQEQPVNPAPTPAANDQQLPPPQLPSLEEAKIEPLNATPTPVAPVVVQPQPEAVTPSVVQPQPEAAAPSVVQPQPEAVAPSVVQPQPEAVAPTVVQVQPQPEQQPAKSLYERLGGVYSIAAVIDDFVDRLLINPTVLLNQNVVAGLKHINKPGLKFLITEMICEATGGTQKYSGRSMKESHQYLNITEIEWKAMVDDLIATLKKFSVPEKEQNELLAILSTTKADIVTSKLESTEPINPTIPDILPNIPKLEIPQVKIPSLPSLPEIPAFNPPKPKPPTAEPPQEPYPELPKPIQ